jgi:hypothetical protein
MWAQTSYSLRPSSRRGDGSTISMATVRHLRSAASQFLGWEMMVRNPLNTFLDQHQRVLNQGCRATDNYSYSLFSKGMTGRLGSESIPSAPLLFRHVFYMDQTFNQNYLNATTFDAKRRWALAGLANLLLWLGWLRSMETFSLTYADVLVVDPANGRIYELPAGLGMLLLRLLPQTKSNRNTRADVVIAHTTLSGLSPGRWCERLSLLLFGTADWPTSPSPIFLEPDGTPWSVCNNFRQVVIPISFLSTAKETQFQTSSGPYTCTVGVHAANLRVAAHTLISPLKLPSLTKSTNMDIGASAAPPKPLTNNIVNGLMLSVCI